MRSRRALTARFAKDEMQSINKPVQRSARSRFTMPSSRPTAAVATRSQHDSTLMLAINALINQYVLHIELEITNQIP